MQIETYKDGKVISTRTVEIPAEQDREDRLRARVDGQLADLKTAVNGWDGLTAAQRTAATKQALRVVLALSRLVLRRFDADDEPPA